MRHGNPTVHDLIPLGFAGQDLASYLTLLPLYNGEQDAFSRWAAFLPDGPDEDGPDKVEQLRTLDLYDLRHAAVDAGKDMAGWDSPRGRISGTFAATLGEALGEFVPGDAAWTIMRWQGHKHDLPGARTVTSGEVPYDLQELDLAGALASIRELGMPEFLWCSAQSFAWGAPLYADFGVMTMAAEHYIRYFAPRDFECFYLPPDSVLPDNLGD